MNDRNWKWVRVLFLFGISFAFGACALIDALRNPEGPDDASTDSLLDAATDAGISTFAQQAYIKASNPDSLDLFGGRIAISADGNTLAVGAANESSSATGINGNQNDDTKNFSGAVYVFTRNGGIWGQQAYLKASNTDGNDGFGVTVAISSDGNTLAVGSAEDSAASGVDGNQADNSADRSGAVYIFTRIGTTWSQQAYVKASNTQTADNFGVVGLALAGDGNTLAVGAAVEDSAAVGINGNQADNSKSQAGAVYVFVRSGAVWSQQAYVKASNTDANDAFGYTVALSANGNTLAVGATAGGIGESSAAMGINGSQDDNSADSAGAVYIFTRSGANWSQQAYVKASNTGAGDSFGIQVALSADGNTLVAGAVVEASGAVGINGDQSDNSALASGAAYVFTRAGTVWSQQAYLKASNAEAGDGFGGFVIVSGDGTTVAIAADLEASASTGIDGDQTDNSAVSAGAVYVFRRAGTSWSQLAYLKASNTEESDRFGSSAALSHDGTSIVVGAANESSGDVGVDGDQTDNSASRSGAAYVFQAPPQNGV